MEMSKISNSSGSSSTALLPEASENRYEQLDLSNQNAVEQSEPSCLSTALKVLLAVPLFLIHTIGRALQAVEKAGLSLINCLRSAFSSGAMEALDPSKLTDLSHKDIYNKPLLKIDSQEAATKTDALSGDMNTASGVSVNSQQLENTDTITLVEGDADEWEEDIQTPGRIFVNYPEPQVSPTPSNKGGYWNTIAKTVGLLAVATGLAATGYSYMNFNDNSNS